MILLDIFYIFTKCVEDLRRNFNNFNFSFLFNVIYFLKRFIFLKEIKNEIYTHMYIYKAGMRLES